MLTHMHRTTPISPLLQQVRRQATDERREQVDLPPEYVEGWLHQGVRGQRHGK
jgi:hypothetical protein